MVLYEGLGENMRCYNCGASLSEKSYCTSCGSDVAVYKKIIGLSNLYYNDGLAKAKVRDLSGAIISLKRSLKFHKNNIPARNLLGLVYFEIGETVAALGQWILSTNIQPEKNIAHDYMKTLSSNQGKLDSINQTIRKYNVCLDYCRQESYDLAVIQLKKLLSVNTHLVQGYQLLALLYIREQDYEKAYKQLQLALKIDKANTTTLHLIREISDDESGHHGKIALKSDEGIRLIKRSQDKVEYYSGNETIIQPANIKENNGLWTIINIVIGLVVGAAVTGFLILPAQNQVIKNKYKSKENATYEELQEKKAQIDSLNAQIAQLQGSVDSANAQLSNYEGDSGVITGLVSLVEAEKIFAGGNIADTFAKIVTVNREVLPDGAKALWQELYDKCINQILDEAKKQYTERNNADSAINYYQQVLSVDGENEDAMYNYAAALKKKGSRDEAIQKINEYLQKYPTGKYASDASKALGELQGQ